MPYADLDLAAGRKNGTVWVTLPNRNYDPEKGHRLYNRYLDELEYGEELGFDVVAVNEHHQTAYGLMPSPIVTASARLMSAESTVAMLVPTARFSVAVPVPVTTTSLKFTALTFSVMVPRSLSTAVTLSVRATG